MQVDEGVEVRGTQHTWLSDTAVYSSLRGSVGSVRGNRHIFWSVVPAPRGERQSIGAAINTGFSCFRDCIETHLAVLQNSRHCQAQGILLMVLDPCIVFPDVAIKNWQLENQKSGKERQTE